MEMYNEFTVFMCSMLMMCFTDYIPDIETQSIMGWQMIGTIVLNCAINVTIIVSIGGKGVYLIIKKYYRLAKFKIYGPAEKKYFDPIYNKQLSEQEFINLNKKKNFSHEIVEASSC